MLGTVLLVLLILLLLGALPTWGHSRNYGERMDHRIAVEIDVQRVDL